MEYQIEIPPVGADGPWGAPPEQVLKEVQTLLPVEAVAMGMLRVPKPQIDGMLAVTGWPTPEIEKLLDSGFDQHPLIKTALKAGVAVGGPSEPLLSAGRGKISQTLVIMVAESSTKRLWWWAAFGRKGNAFNDTECEIASLLVRRWQARFHRADEPGVGRILLGHDDRLLLADLDTQAAFLTQPAMLDDLMREFRPIVNQRFPDLPEHASRDLALLLAGRPTWVRFQHSKSLDKTEGVHTYIELRTIKDDELPIIGVVADERIAKAIAYLHENYPDSPSLTQLARQIHMSPFHFHRLFSRQTGISPKHYLQKKQLQVAKWLLRSSKEQIGAIAAHTGFASHGHFTSTFHRVIGISPSEFRQER